MALCCRLHLFWAAVSLSVLAKPLLVLCTRIYICGIQIDAATHHLMVLSLNFFTNDRCSPARTTPHSTDYIPVVKYFVLGAGDKITLEIPRAR